MAVLHSSAVLADTGATVRLSFSQGVHPDVSVQPGELTIGAAPGNSVVLAADGIQPRHASIVVDPRGFTLFVHDPNASAHVNARPVREKAILRLGDVVSLGTINVVLKPEYDTTVSNNRPNGPASGEPAPQQTPARAVLRGVSGPYFGKVIPIQGRTTIGRGPGCSIVLDEPEMGAQHATLEIEGSQITLRDHGSGKGTTINGVQVRDANVFTGDQIAFDRNRFLVEAPGMPVRTAESKPADAPTPEPKQRVEVTQTMRAIRPEQVPQPQAAAQSPAASPASPARQPALKVPSRSPQPEPAKGFNPWWLLVAAAIIAGGIAWLLIANR